MKYSPRKFMKPRKRDLSCKNNEYVKELRNAIDSMILDLEHGKAVGEKDINLYGRRSIIKKAAYATVMNDIIYNNTYILNNAFDETLDGFQTNLLLKEFLMRKRETVFTIFVKGYSDKIDKKKPNRAVIIDTDRSLLFLKIDPYSSIVISNMRIM